MVLYRLNLGSSRHTAPGRGPGKREVSFLDCLGEKKIAPDDQRRAGAGQKRARSQFTGKGVNQEKKKAKRSARGKNGAKKPGSRKSKTGESRLADLVPAQALGTRQNERGLPSGVEKDAGGGWGKKRREREGLGGRGSGLDVEQSLCLYEKGDGGWDRNYEGKAPSLFNRCPRVGKCARGLASKSSSTAGARH